MAPEAAWGEDFLYGVETYDEGVPAFATHYATTQPPQYPLPDGSELTAVWPASRAGRRTSSAWGATSRKDDSSETAHGCCSRPQRSRTPHARQRDDTRSRCLECNRTTQATGPAAGRSFVRRSLRSISLTYAAQRRTASSKPSSTSSSWRRPTSSSPTRTCGTGPSMAATARWHKAARSGRRRGGRSTGCRSPACTRQAATRTPEVRSPAHPAATRPP